MARHSEQVVLAVLAMAEAALPSAEVERDAPWPFKVAEGGQVIVRDGEPGEPEECFSPNAFTYRHAIPLEVFAPESVADRHAFMDAMLTALADRLELDRSLGGLCSWADLDAPSPDDVASAASQPIRAAVVTLTAEYTTTRRLG